MLEDYRNRVILTYKEKKESGELSPNLTHPTPAMLKKECLEVLNSRFEKKDEPFIKSLFNSGTESNDYSSAIRRFDVDRFRPLNNFLKEATEEPEHQNVELLAWLINFEPRPYNFKVDYTAQSITGGLKVDLYENEKAEKENEKTGPNIYSIKKNPIARKPIVSKIRIAVVLLIVLIGGVYLSIASSGSAYVCEQGTGTKYHLNPKCPSLKNCKNGVVETTIEEAKKNGKSLCGFEKI